MSEFPLTGSGKIDRKALPRPEAAAREESVYVAPRSDLEKRMAELWQEVLKLPKVGIDDNFFTIGGQSLKAAFLLARMQKQLGLRVEMQGFFKTPTIRQLCEQAGSAVPGGEEPTLPQLVPAVSPQVIVGRWSHRRQDDEARSADTVTVEFMPDGRYVARNRNGRLPTPEKPSHGRYSIANLQGTAFDLRIERDLADPESDPLDAIEVQRITVIDPDTLQAADGSIVRRVKE